MALFPLGILSAAGAEVVGPAYELIETSILGSAQSEVVFSSLATYASTYKHLQIRATARTTRTEINDAIFIRLNGNTGANYARHQMFGNGSSVSSIAGSSETSTGNNALPGANSTANSFGALVFDLVDAYSSTKNTTIKSFSGLTASFDQVMLASGLFNNTASITSVTLFSNSTFVAGSRFSIYGIKG
jgi:hypothetical protein